MYVYMCAGGVFYPQKPQRQHKMFRSRAKGGKRCLGDARLTPISLGGQGKSGLRFILLTAHQSRGSEFDSRPGGLLEGG